MKDGQVSSTALTVAQGILYTSEHDPGRNLVPPEWVEANRRLLGASPQGRRRLRLLRSWWFPRLVPLMEQALIPGITRHYVLRKREIESVVRGDCRKGVTQFVNLGAGFDTLFWRLHREFEDRMWIEIDHPSTQAVKTRALRSELGQGDNMQSVALELGETNVAEGLSTVSRLDCGIATTYVCEGVLPYLREAEVRSLMESLKRLSGVGARVLFTFVEPRTGQSYGPLLNIYLRLKGEPLCWTLPRTEVEGFLRECGYRLESLLDAEDLQERYLAPGVPRSGHTGECLAVAEAL